MLPWSTWWTLQEELPFLLARNIVMRLQSFCKDDFPNERRSRALFCNNSVCSCLSVFLVNLGAAVGWSIGDSVGHGYVHTVLGSVGSVMVSAHTGHFLSLSAPGLVSDLTSLSLFPHP